MTLRTDMEELINNRRREEYQPAKLACTVKDGEQTELKVNVIPRGNYRRRICSFPPVRLNFSKKYLAKKGLTREYDKMKLVTMCQGGKDGRGLLLKEYLAYKFYNLLTPNSYRVQLAKITYIDTEGNREDEQQYGILVEDTDEMAHRVGGEECECRNYPQDSIAAEVENIMAVFQYMIGNEDWSMQMLRNTKVVRPDDGSPFVPVPYDFDFSGFVNAPYAVPRSELNMLDIRDRIFLGFPVEVGLLNQTLKQFEEQHSLMIMAIQNLVDLRSFERKAASNYIDSFFKKKNQRKLIEQATAPQNKKDRVIGSAARN